MLPQTPRPGRRHEPVRRKAFRIGGSIAVRLPKDLVDAVGLRAGSPVVFRREGKAIVVEAAAD